jgi:hypothetical protein
LIVSVPSLSLNSLEMTLLLDVCWNTGRYVDGEIGIVVWFEKELWGLQTCLMHSSVESINQELLKCMQIGSILSSITALYCKNNWAFYTGGLPSPLKVSAFFCVICWVTRQRI